MVEEMFHPSSALTNKCLLSVLPMTGIFVYSCKVILMWGMPSRMKGSEVWAKPTCS